MLACEVPFLPFYLFTFLPFYFFTFKGLFYLFIIQPQLACTLVPMPS